MTNIFSAEDMDREITRLNGLVATLREEIVNLRGQINELGASSDDVLYFVDETDCDISDFAETSAAANSAIAEAAAAGAEALAFAADGNLVATQTDAFDNLLPYQIYCDRLTFIKGIEIDDARLLADLGVTRFMDIAAFNAEDVSEVNAMLNAPGHISKESRISKEGWIEQAALLARGDMTKFALQIEDGAQDSDEIASSAELAVEIAAEITSAAKVESAKSDSKTKAEPSKVIDLDAARQKKLNQNNTASAGSIGDSTKGAMRWSVVAASIALLGSVLVVGATMSGKLGNWHEAFQNMAGLL